MRMGIIAFTRRGCELAMHLSALFAQEGEEVQAFGPVRLADEVGVCAFTRLDSWTGEAFRSFDALVFVGACGIAVRAIAPYVTDKMTDPAVVCVDEAGQFAVALLSGHVGGANALARRVAHACDGRAVVSTATDVNSVFAVDEWATQQGLALLERDVAKEISAALLEGDTVGFTSDYVVGGPLPQGLVTVAGTESVTTEAVGAGGDSEKTDQAALETGLDAADLQVRSGTTDITATKPALSTLDTSSAQLGVCVSLDAGKRPFVRTLHLVPRVVTVGVGCKRGTSAEAIGQVVDQCLEEARVVPQAVCSIASIDVKADEEGLLTFARDRGWRLRLHTAGELAAVPGDFHSSSFVQQTVGVDNVCERAACACGERLLLPRHSAQGVTVALAAKKPQLTFAVKTGACAESAVQETRSLTADTLTMLSTRDSLESSYGPMHGNRGAVTLHIQSECKQQEPCDNTSTGSNSLLQKPSSSHAALTCVGLGPGAGETMTLQARAALERADVIVGYRTYINLIRDAYPHKELLATGMRGEVERCRLALERAARGQQVTVVCSGDPGVYGMAGLLIELAEDYPSVQVDVVPGVSAANAGASVLGAPLMHDWCSISLSDLMTPWETIEKRLRAAAQADFCIVLYNPASHGRADHLQRACDILLQYCSPQTVCGLVRNIGRKGEASNLLTLSQLRNAPADMLTCVFVGNSQTRVVNGRMVTPRGYQRRDD